MYSNIVFCALLLIFCTVKGVESTNSTNSTTESPENSSTVPTIDWWSLIDVPEEYYTVHLGPVEYPPTYNRLIKNGSAEYIVEYNYGCNELHFAASVIPKQHTTINTANVTWFADGVKKFNYTLKGTPTAGSGNTYFNFYMCQEINEYVCYVNTTITVAEIVNVTSYRVDSKDFNVTRETIIGAKNISSSTRISFKLVFIGDTSDGLSAQDKRVLIVVSIVAVCMVVAGALAYLCCRS